LSSSSCGQFLCLCSSILEVTSLFCFFLDLRFNFSENTISLIVKLCWCDLARLLKCLLQFVAEFYEVLHNLDLSIERDRSVVVIKDSLDESFTVAFVEKLLNLGPVISLAGDVER
jgi:hypothetical protein